MLKTVKAFLIICTIFSSTAFAQIEVEWKRPANGSEKLFKGALQNTNIIDDAVSMGKRPLLWPEGLTIIMGGKGQPRYEMKSASIHMPYSYLADTVKAQDNFEETRAASLQAGLNMLEYTLYHLIGHALLNDPSVDKDKAAENIATWMMVTGFKNGGEQWLEDVNAFSRASQKLDGPLEEYWHAHSLYKLRAEQLNCLVVGSAPMRYLERYPGLIESPEVARECEQNWLKWKSAIEDRLTLKN